MEPGAKAQPPRSASKKTLSSISSPSWATIIRP
jgi:hypothetical protein